MENSEPKEGHRLNVIIFPNWLIYSTRGKKITDISRVTDDWRFFYL
jgi:hypothetical protein